MGSEDNHLIFPYIAT
jgi:N-ethylmaleimide reductase